MDQPKKMYLDEELAAIDELSYDILMSLRTGLPVSTINEYKLMCLLEDGDLSVTHRCPNLFDLIEYFLDNGTDRAWNLGNMLIS